MRAIDIKRRKAICAVLITSIGSWIGAIFILGYPTWVSSGGYPSATLEQRLFRERWVRVFVERDRDASHSGLGMESTVHSQGL